MKSPSGKLVEPLTRRERAILLHLAEDKSNREIAALEVLSLNSVKWYIQQLYGKLGVNRRREAIERARGLGFLPTPEPIVAPETTPAKARPSPLPTGTITFLFTDIEDSTPLWEQHPQEMAAALQIHNAALRQAIEANGGVVFKTVGDAFQAAFATASQALKAAMEGQHALQSSLWNEIGPLKVRMGLHTGEAELDPKGEEYVVSHTKNRVARIMSAAHGGQVLLSAETFELCDHQLPHDVSLKDLGEYRLKGMATLEHLYQVCVSGMPQNFPPLTTGIIHLHNLPAQLSSFIGREREIDEVVGLLEKHRLVTLTGAGVRDPRDQPKAFDHLMRTLLGMLSGAVLRDSQEGVSMIRASDLDWTVVRVPMLTDGPLTGKFRVGYVGKDSGRQISRADAAAFMLQQLEDDTYFYQAPMISY